MAGKVEVLHKIKEAEAEAARIEEQAKAEARKILDDATQQADYSISHAKTAADAAYADAVAKAQADVQKERAALVKKGEDRAKATRSKAETPDFKKAVDQIVAGFESKLGK